MKLTFVFLVMSISMVIATPHKNTEPVSAPLKTTTRVVSRWTVTGSEFSTRIVAVANGVTYTLKVQDTNSNVIRLLKALSQNCVLDYKQRCDLINFLLYLLRRNGTKSNVRQALENLRSALAADKEMLTDNTAKLALTNINAVLNNQPGNLVDIAWLAHSKMLGAGLGGHCTYNFRECAARSKSFRHRKHHCYWAIFRCTQDMDTRILRNSEYCGWLMQASVYHMTTLR